MKTQSVNPQKTQGVSRRELLKAGLAAVWPAIALGGRSGAAQARGDPPRLGL